MKPAELMEEARRKRSLLCVGLDPSEEALPPAVWQGGLPTIEAYLRQVIEATQPWALAYKFNVAFYERWGAAGWEVLSRLRAFLPASVLAIADAKRGDIAYTSRAYAEAFFERMGFEAVTVHPYLGWEALKPFWDWPDKWVFVLVRTTEAPPWQGQVWQEIILSRPAASAQIGWVWGAFYGAELKALRQLDPASWLLVPGLGAQGGQLPAGAPLFPALVVVGRSLLKAPHTASDWAAQTASFLP
ncbi:MAG: hypothetical protein KatS3mg026_1708 [Bacteroidia bacterium]|nr:MAG: hypothetical protein KatS3mg026_1708 [Bacteroidia bacterium]